MGVRILPSRGLERGRPVGPSEPGRINLADMDELIAAGEAQPLLDEFDVGPTFYLGLWWVVPAGEWDRGFTAASEPEQRELSETFLRVQRATEIVAVGQYLDAQRAARTAEEQARSIQALQDADARANVSARETTRPRRVQDHRPR